MPLNSSGLVLKRVSGSMHVLPAFRKEAKWLLTLPFYLTTIANGKEHSLGVNDSKRKRGPSLERASTIFTNFL